MPAWMAGIQARRDASGNVHVNLGSSTPCWNDDTEANTAKPSRDLARYGKHVRLCFRILWRVTVARLQL
jgi:hypothetical protein